MRVGSPSHLVMRTQSAEGSRREPDLRVLPAHWSVDGKQKSNFQLLLLPISFFLFLSFSLSLFSSHPILPCRLPSLMFLVRVQCPATNRKRGRWRILFGGRVGQNFGGFKLYIIHGPVPLNRSTYQTPYQHIAHSVNLLVQRNLKAAHWFFFCFVFCWIGQIDEKFHVHEMVCK